MSLLIYIIWLRLLLAVLINYKRVTVQTYRLSVWFKMFLFLHCTDHNEAICIPFKTIPFATKLTIITFDHFGGNIANLWVTHRIVSWVIFYQQIPQILFRNILYVSLGILKVTTLTFTKVFLFYYILYDGVNNPNQNKLFANFPANKLSDNSIRVQN